MPGSGRGAVSWCVPMWEARDLAAGNSPWRINHTVSLAMDSLERDLYNNGIADPKRYEEIYQQQLLLDLVERRIAEDHRPEIREVFKMLRQGYNWDEIGSGLGTSIRKLSRSGSGDGCTATSRQNPNKPLASPKAYAIMTDWRT